MPTTQLIVGLGAGLFVLTCTIVGCRLLWLAWRTRELPELCIGSGLVCIVAIGFPALVGAGLGPGPVSVVNLPLVMAGLIAILVGTVCLYAFTWRVFRATETWAKAVVAAAGAGLCAVVVGSMHALVTAPGDALSFEVVSDWMAGVRVAILCAYLWTGTESWLQYRMARRRLGLGLADPVATNRLLLWSLTGAVEAGINGADLILHLQGLSPIVDPQAMMVTVAGGVVASAMMYVTFLPPRAYLRWVRGRAGLATG